MSAGATIVGIHTLFATGIAVLAVALPGNVTPPLEPGAPAGPAIAHRAALRVRADVTDAGALLVIENDGPAAAVRVRLTAPATVRTGVRSCTHTAAALRCLLGTIPPRGTARIPLRHAGRGPA